MRVSEGRATGPSCPQRYAPTRPIAPAAIAMPPATRGAHERGPPRAGSSAKAEFRQFPPEVVSSQALSNRESTTVLRVPSGSRSISISTRSTWSPSSTEARSGCAYGSL